MGNLGLNRKGYFWNMGYVWVFVWELRIFCFISFDIFIILVYLLVISFWAWVRINFTKLDFIPLIIIILVLS
jgi:hypothetical protein